MLLFGAQHATDRFLICKDNLKKLSIKPMPRSKVRLRVSTPSSKKVGFSFCFFQSDAVVFLYDHKAASITLTWLHTLFRFDTLKFLCAKRFQQASQIFLPSGTPNLRSICVSRSSESVFLVSRRSLSLFWFSSPAE